MQDDDLIDEEDYRVVKVLKAFANGVRFEIVRLLDKAPRSVSKLVDELERGRSSVSHHLRVLRDVDLLRTKTEGRKAVYHPKRQDVIEAVMDLRTLLRREE